MRCPRALTGVPIGTVDFVRPGGDSRGAVEEVVVSRSRQKSPRRSPLWALAPAAVLVFAGWQTVATLSRTPAFNRSYLLETDDGGQVPRYGIGMYDRAQYTFLIARGWFFRAMREMDEAAENPAAAGETGQDEIRRARDIATESLRINPADPAAWMLLARTDVALGNLDAAVQGYLTSNALSPNSSIMAGDRLNFRNWLMADAAGYDLALASIPVDAVRRDLDVIRRRSEKTYEMYVAAPAVRAFLAPEN